MDRDITKAISLGNGRYEDELIWYNDSIFSLKSWYNMGSRAHLGDDNSFSPLLKEWWLGVWNLGIPPQMKVFI